MPVSLTCSCGVFLEVDDRFAGQTITCPDCGKPLQAPPLEPLPQRTSGLALASLIGSLVGAFTVVVPFVSALLGLAAVRQIARNRERLAGHNIALAGIVLGLAFGAGGLYVFRTGLIDPDRLINRLPLAGKVETGGDLEIIRSREGYRITRPSDKWGIWHQQATEDNAAPVGEPLVLLNPGQDAYVTCLVTRSGDGESLQQCKTKALDEFREPNFSGSADLMRNPPRLIERTSQPLPKGNKIEGIELLLEKTHVGLNRTYLVRVIKSEVSPDVFLLVASARKSRFPRLEAELRAILDTFQVSPGVD
jgi:hypothetical protein